MDIHARLSFLRIAPRKVRLIAKELCGLSVDQATTVLQYLPQRSSAHLLKLLRSAVANAKHNYEIDADKLFVREVRVGGGAKLKRFMPRAKGSAYRIEKKTSHIDLFLAEKEPGEKRTGKKSDIVTRKIEDLSAEDLATKKVEKNAEDKTNSSGAVKKTGQAKSSRQVFQRRGGES